MCKMHKCIFIIQKGKILCFKLYKKNTIKIIKTAKDYYVDSIDKFWKWFKDANSYIYGEDVVDLCIVSDKKYSINYEDIDLASNTIWTIDKVKNLMLEKYYKVSVSLEYYENGKKNNVIINNKYSNKVKYKFFISVPGRSNQELESLEINNNTLINTDEGSALYKYYKNKLITHNVDY